MKKNLMLLSFLSVIMLAGCGGNTSSAAEKTSSASTSTVTSSTTTSTTSSAAASANTPASSVTSSAPAASSAQESSVLPPVVTHVVTFETNGGSAIDPVTVNEGETVARPADPTKEGSYLENWYSDAALTTAYDFNTPVIADITLYANWASSDGTCVVNFYWNYDGAPDNGVYLSTRYTDNGRVTKPSDPVRDGYYFVGWFEDDAGVTSFSFLKKRTGELSIYAYWKTEYTFEAEYTQLTNLPEDDDTANEVGEKLGYGYSNNPTGVQLIQAEGTSGINASNGYYIASIYYKGAYLEFDFTSDVAVTDAALSLRLTEEYYSNTLTKDIFKVQLNGTDISYEDITFDNVITDPSSMSKRPFTNYFIGSGLTLNEGSNVLKLIVNNSSKQGSTGTINAIAPLVDCAYFTTTANLTMTKYNTSYTNATN